MMIVESTIQRLAEMLVIGTPDIRYKNIVFPVQEIEYPDPVRFVTIRRISIEIPRYLGITPDYLSTSFEVSFFNKRTDEMTRIQTCLKIAERFVKEILPKVDYEIEKELHNRKINEILEALD